MSAAQNKIAGISAEQFDATLKEFSSAVRASWSMRQGTPPSECLKIRRRADLAARNLNILRDVVRLGFAEANGWRYAPKQSFDHTDVFLDPKTKRVAAKVYHGFTVPPYNNVPPAYGEHLPFSWYHGVYANALPGKGFAVLVKELV